MATRTTVEVLTNLQSGRDFIPVGRHILEESPFADVLQTEIDAGSRHVNLLGSVEIPDPESEDGAPAPAAAPVKPPRKRTPAGVPQE